MTAIADKTQTEILPSFVAGSWWAPEDPQKVTDVLDANTGQLMARVSTDGIDTAAVIEYGRTVGQKSLGELTIHERALKLKELALYLNSRIQELYDLSFATGATQRDHAFDVDGGIGTLFTFSGKGRRELPNSNVIVDGKVEPLSRDGSFIGEHIYQRIPGVAVQINAFNFPVWGMLEKFAPAFVAGVPTVVKPATPTGYVTEACVRMMLESGILPEGSLQLISGSARDLLDHLDYRDHVAFTGSAGTAETLRRHENVLTGGVRFTAETDSLNAAILGPDADKDSPEFEAFVKVVFQEMTVKAGQKCTAIRRVIVPEAMVEDVTAALTERLSAKVVLGDPRTEGTTMGALASKEQQSEVRKAVQTLVDAGGQVRLGGPDGSTGDADAEAGAFFAPTVLSFADARTPAVHEVEAFGPVTSVIGYTDVDDAVALAALGSGSLVATVATNDGATARAFAAGIGAHHGRVHFLNRQTAKTTTGHGAPVPVLVHGGPGRAGGGEELGGVRGVKHYMQRTAIQGSPDLLTAITGVWHQGAAANTVTREDVEAGTATHPFYKALDELRIGDQFASGLRTVTLEDITKFAEETGDMFYAHTDEEAAMANPFFPRRVAHGYLLVSWAAGLFVAPDPGPVLANYGLDDLRFITPVTYDDAIRVTLTAKRITPRVTDEYGEVAWDCQLHNQNDELVAQYDVLTLVAKTWPMPKTEQKA
ncbi:phenylacetic acid degradation bifunctional protein PaaZ [Micrococcus flavus]|uniref:Oxepin-CoA hydrolase/3-oxo-5,6-dehydrosuberyl-CoA semialdehyde dehydrogenase n=1 Tax=Micrococcus flavus TaxID=384602 RepID=A0A4Y8X2U3_9MICC|nr:phenylacetic acid degradation bifunctional protein PaaZ [Micrococcus flavus]MBB4881837.1 oxepin-CoA hydrolase/3-oxo-5,6-dehydrosuberyl-CoA semialdehyde dehydrogenase [Micrococcus flavus]TFI03613.1 phenylacetic acid degradation bifunctional protein PaaZ [Micrococcus flavus]GGK45236.1 putative phenylacetic acid degradation protein PaaN [Micrococcus flavus]